MSREWQWPGRLAWRTSTAIPRPAPIQTPHAGGAWLAPGRGKEKSEFGRRKAEMIPAFALQEERITSLDNLGEKTMATGSAA